jgi:hypothetical protein
MAVKDNDRNGIELPDNTPPNGRTIYVDGGSNGQIIVKAKFPEEDCWSAIPDGPGQEIQEWVEQQVGIPCKVWLQNVNGRYSKGTQRRTRIVIITFTWSGPRGVAGYTEAHACAWNCMPTDPLGCLTSRKLSLFAYLKSSRWYGPGVLLTETWCWTLSPKGNFRDGGYQKILEHSKCYSLSRR